MRASGLRRPLVLAHRGASAEAPENTLAAFRLAEATGAHGVELDVRLTRDGHPVVVHDASLRRTTGRRGAVGALTLAEVRSLDAGAWFGPQFRGEPLPLLGEVLDALAPGTMVDVEIKERGRRGQVAAVRVVAELRRRSAVGCTTATEGAPAAGRPVLVTSFFPSVLRHVRSLAPDLPVGLLLHPRLPWALYRHVFRCLAPRVLLPHRTAVGPGLVAEARRAGAAVIAWGADDRAGIDRLLDVGVDGLITDRPDLALAAVAALRRSGRGEDEPGGRGWTPTATLRRPGPPPAPPCPRRCGSRAGPAPRRPGRG